MNRSIFIYYIYYYILLYNHQQFCIAENSKKKIKKHYNFVRRTINSSAIQKLQTVDVSNLPVETIEELRHALTIIIDRRHNENQILRTNIENLISTSTQRTTFNRVKIHKNSIKRNLDLDLDLNSVKRIDDLLHKVIIKRFQNINSNHDKINKRKSPRFQLIKNNKNPVSNTNAFPELSKAKLCGLDFDLVPVKITGDNNDKNIVTNLKLNVLSRKKFIDNCNNDRNFQSKVK